MVNEEFGVHTEEAVEQVLVQQRAARNPSHRVQAVGSKAVGDAVSDAPEVGQRAVVPQQASESHFIKFGDAHAIFVRRKMFGDDVHGDFGEVEVGTDSGGGSDTRGLEHVPNDGHREFVPRHLVGFQIVGDIHENLVDAIDVNVFGGDIFQIDAIDACAVVNVERHARHGTNEVYLQLRSLSEFRVVP